MSKLDKLLIKTKKLKGIYSKGKLVIKCLDKYVLINTETKTIKDIKGPIDEIPIRQMYISSNELSFKNKYNSTELYITPIDDDSMEVFTRGICNKNKDYDTTVRDIINYKVDFSNVSTGLIKSIINELVS
ncbi:MAG: hypothetical protein ACRDD7_08325 [Peptostreptococcaceae bacterium]